MTPNTFVIRIVPGLDAPCHVVAFLRPDGTPDDIAQFYLRQDAQDYTDWLNEKAEGFEDRNPATGWPNP